MFYIQKSIENGLRYVSGLRYVRGLQVKLIDGDNVNQAKSHKWVCHILKNTLGTCFIPNFQRVINGLRYVRSGASKLGRVPQVGMSYSQKHT